MSGWVGGWVGGPSPRKMVIVHVRWVRGSLSTAERLVMSMGEFGNGPPDYGVSICL